MTNRGRPTKGTDPATNASTWARAIRGLLREARKPRTKIAELANLDGSLITRYLTGERRPRPEHIRYINRAVATLLATPPAEHYLNAVAFADNLLVQDDDAIEEAAFEAVSAWTMIAPSMKDGYEDGLWELAEAWSPERQRKLVADLALAYRKRFVRHLDGKTEPELAVSTVVRICKKHGLDLSPWLRDDAPGRGAEERFLGVLRHELARVVRDITEREGIEARIMEAFCRYVLDTPGIPDMPDRLLATLRLDHYRKVQKAARAATGGTR